jgi:hypothetical protein
MDTKKVLTEIKEIEEQLDALSEQRKTLREKFSSLAKDYSNYIGEKYTGLKIGDRINFTRKTWRRSENVTMQVTGFNAYIREDKTDDKGPTITGVRVLKSGEIGTRSENVYFHENIKWTKVDIR